MTILLLGTGPRFDWLREWLNKFDPEQRTAILIANEPLTRESLSALLSEQIDTVALVDHHPFAAGAPAAGLSTLEIVRGESQRAVFALELARRAVRTLVLADGAAESWPLILASLANMPSLLLPPSCPPVPTPGETGDGALTRAYLQPLFAAARPASRLALTWPREVFLHGDVPGSVLPAAIELAGRARILTYGPYLPLPAGSWRATAYLGFSVEIEKMPFILEIETGSSVTRGFFEVNNGGIFTLALGFQVTDPLHPIELRLISQDSALEGKAALIEVQLEQISR